MTTNPTTTKPKRPWLRFSLRTLLVFMLVVGVGFGFIRDDYNRIQEKWRLIEEIKDLGGNVNFAIEIRWFVLSNFLAIHLENLKPH